MVIIIIIVSLNDFNLLFFYNIYNNKSYKIINAFYGMNFNISTFDFIKIIIELFFLW